MGDSSYNPGSNFTRSSGYGNRNIRSGTEFHGGVDYAAPAGTPIPAASSGTVVYSGLNGSGSGKDGSGYGNTVVVRSVGADGTPYHTLYGHQNGNDMPKVGDSIKQGGKIGEVGNTGLSEGNHLHFEVLDGGVKIPNTPGGPLGFHSSDPTIRQNPDTFNNWSEGGPHQGSKQPQTPPAAPSPADPPTNKTGDAGPDGADGPQMARETGDDERISADASGSNVGAPSMAAPIAMAANVPAAPTLLTGDMLNVA